MVLKVKIWLDRITDESNLWLNATKLEDAGKYFEAITLYLNDASSCLKKNELLKAALSCSAAANCLSKLGDFILARKLFQGAAMMYEEYSELILGESIRESLWSTEEAYEHFLLAGNDEKSKQIYHKYVSLATKADPFFGEVDAIRKLESRKIPHTLTEKGHKNNLTLSSEVNKAIEDFLQLSLRQSHVSKNLLNENPQLIQSKRESQSNSHEMNESNSNRSPV